jgi:hypothetical protein
MSVKILAGQNSFGEIDQNRKKIVLWNIRGLGVREFDFKKDPFQAKHIFLQVQYF